VGEQRVARRPALLSAAALQRPTDGYAHSCVCETVRTIRLFASVCIEAPAEVVWARLARLEDIRLWSEAVLDARCEGALSQGVGAERTCDLRGGITIRECWLAWDEGRSFTYEGVGIPLLASARNEWDVQPEGDQTLLTSRAEVVLKGGPLGRLLEPFVAYQLKRVGPRTLAAFKYLVEHGEPPKVRHAKLPRVATAC
jgi:Polyketide cyclase / dehydrase and lipid transport